MNIHNIGGRYQIAVEKGEGRGIIKERSGLSEHGMYATKREGPTTSILLQPLFP